ncbi:MAG: sigma 54-interacting transcriptional regulator [Candidatus Hatepunaea meridiana]|nr:sigma 54-interacting transcriptional regulator [Candidatus Hatepunaea meridiana]
MSKTEELSRAGLELLLEAARGLLEEPNLDKLLPALLGKAFEVVGAERGYILLRNESDELTPVTARGIEPGSLPDGDPSKSVIETALKEHRPVFSRNATRDPRFSGASSLIIRGIRSACCIPLEAHGNRIGALYLDATGSGKLTERELPLLEAFGSLAALALARSIELKEARNALQTATKGLRFSGIVGESEVMCRMYDRMERIATADLPVLISGESGTGKELIARALHSTGSRKDKPLRAIFCGNLTAELLESELFGYRKGAFTGAITDKPGLIDLADKGILFLDEIADVPTAIQAKLLRFLQDGEYQRLGDPNPRYADVRVFSATNKSLTEGISAGRFREDLYYRLNVLTIEAPPLRERVDDIPLLAATILTRVASRTGQSHRRISPAALDRLSGYSWPGNVRELENVLARAAVLTTSDTIDPEDLDLVKSDTRESKEITSDLDLQSVTEAHIMRVLKLAEGNRTEAANILGVSRRFLQKTLARWREEEVA